MLGKPGCWGAAPRRAGPSRGGRWGGSRSWRGALVVGGCFLVGGTSLSLHAQGTISVLQTGSGQPLVSAQQVLQIGSVTTPWIQFDFGFVTDETPTPGLFPDSFTVNLQDPAADVAVVATADANGFTWAPTSPGAVALTAAQIQREAITPPSLSPVLGLGKAYTVQVPVPAAFNGSSVSVIFDLYDNQNSQMSLGWYRNLQVISIPEPTTELLFVLGLALVAGKWRAGQ